MRGGKPRAGVFLRTAFGEHGAAWSIDLTGAYRDVTRVTRSVVHLLPGLVAVLDDCQLPAAEPVTLRWHTADRAAIDAGGSFRVRAAGPRGPVRLCGQICPLSGGGADGGAVTFRRGEHRYRPPYDRTRLNEPLEQRRESFVAADAHGSRCRLLTLFVIAGPGAPPPAWPPERRGDAWRMPTAEGAIAAVSVGGGALTASAAGRTLRLPLP